MQLDDPRIILAGVVGSRAYGLETPQSDTDVGGIYLASLRDVLSLTGFRDTHHVANAEDGSPDRTLHEVGKYMTLASKGNPTALEYLFLDEYFVRTHEGELLRKYRTEFLSQAVRATYTGYARQQFKRLDEKGFFESSLRNRTEKHARHLVRLCLQAKFLLEEGHLRIKLLPSEVDYCRMLGRLAAEDLPRFTEYANFLIDDIDNCVSYLPLTPDVEFLDDLLFEIRIGR